MLKYHNFVSVWVPPDSRISDCLLGQTRTPLLKVLYGISLMGMALALVRVRH